MTPAKAGRAAGLAVRRGNRGRRETTIWFVASRREFERRFVTEEAIREVALPRQPRGGCRTATKAAFGRIGRQSAALDESGAVN